jgi:uncharacterized repeat protein (TIGR02543 family)
VQGGTAVTLPGGSGMTAPAPAGRSFVKWNTATNGTGVSYNANTTYNGNANITLYAQWTPAYTVTFNYNNGVGAPNQYRYYVQGGAAVTLPNPTAAVASGGFGWTAPGGMAFTKWTDSSGTSYNANATYNSNADITLYPMWELFSTVTFNVNGGGGESPQYRYYVRTTTPLTLPDPTAASASGGFSWTAPAPVGRSFVKWTTAADGSGASYNANATYSGYVDITLYAQWTPVYTVTFDKNGGTGTAPAPLAYVPGVTTAQALPGGSGMTAPPVKQFKGWNANDAGAGAHYEAGYSYGPPAADVTLYAEWGDPSVTGSGTAADPWIIFNQSHLVQIPTPQYGLDKHYRLGADFTISGAYTPIGTLSDNANTHFTGSLDGGGHTITFASGLNITPTSYIVDVNGITQFKYAGLFGYIGSGGTVTDLNLAGAVTLNNDDTYYLYAGALAGLILNGSIENITSSVSVAITTIDFGLANDGAYVGGIVGNVSSSSITNCYVTGAVTVTLTGTGNGAYTVAGGIAGTGTASTYSITNCHVTGAVQAANSSGIARAGGIAGTNTGAISNCFATGTVQATGGGTTVSGTSLAADAGGITGLNTGAVSNCFATGSITAASIGSNTTYAGGIVGHNGTVSACVALNTLVRAQGGSANYAGRVIGDGTGTNNWAVNMTVTQGATSSTPTSSDPSSYNGADFTGSANQGSWTNASGPGWTIGTGNDAHPWMWNSSTNRPKLYWED